jgi:signal peptidase I
MRNSAPAAVAPHWRGTLKTSRSVFSTGKQRCSSAFSHSLLGNNCVLSDSIAIASVTWCINSYVDGSRLQGFLGLVVSTMAFVVRLLVIYSAQLLACGALHAGSTEEPPRCFRMESGSMLPTIATNSFVSIVPYTNISNARRGDVVAFRHPVTNSVWVKRLIGMPSDKIQMKQGRLYINGELVEREPVTKIHTEDFYGRETDVPTYKETLPGGVKHTIIEIQGDTGFNDNTQVFEVPPNNYFMMGDNRDNSTDSRVPTDQDGVGYVPDRNITGYVSTDAGGHGEPIEMIDFLVDGRSYIEKRITITGCQFSFASAETIACVAFKIAEDTKIPNAIGQVLIASQSLEKESLRRALRKCSDFNNRRECSGDVT